MFPLLTFIFIIFIPLFGQIRVLLSQIMHIDLFRAFLSRTSALVCLNFYGFNFALCALTALLIFDPIYCSRSILSLGPNFYAKISQFIAR